MAKLPRYMSAGPIRKIGENQYSVTITINTRHPAFLWEVLKLVLAEYRWWYPSTWWRVLTVILHLYGW